MYIYVYTVINIDIMVQYVCQLFCLQDICLLFGNLIFADLCLHSFAQTPVHAQQHMEDARRSSNHFEPVNNVLSNQRTSVTVRQQDVTTKLYRNNHTPLNTSFPGCIETTVAPMTQLKSPPGQVFETQTMDLRLKP